MREAGKSLEGVFPRLRAAWLGVFGIPNYDAYLAHMRECHPERPPMDRTTFFAERLNARYGKGRSRCC